MEIDILKRKIGVNFNEDGTAQILVWAPLANGIELRIIGRDKSVTLHKQNFGFWEITTDALTAGSLYQFRVNGEKLYPDPASLSQPEGVHGPSKAISLDNFRWSDNEWKNIPLEDYIIYELHVGTFTPEGSFAGVEKKLGYLKDLGITAIEIMPLAQFPGTRNWGYDGVYPFAVQNSYGGAAGLQQLVDACHKVGLAVIVDVVYNHLGPEGNYLPVFGPYTTNKYKTPWGGAINFDDALCEDVRHYFIENALMWFRDFHIDALRLDAVHAIKDYSPKHILEEMRQYVDAYTTLTKKSHYLIVESDLNDRKLIDPIDKGGYGMDAQWIDEFHHALRATATGEQTGYYSDFRAIEHLAKAYTDAYVYDGQFSEHRKKNFGVKTDNPGQQFIVFSQNHDQVGNRMLGERTSSLVSFEMQKLMAASVMVSPFLPLLFMGEEWGEPNPFLYFVSHTDPKLAEAVREGRKREFAAFYTGDETLDPNDESSFLQSKLQWQLQHSGKHQIMLEFYKSLIELRKSHPVFSKPDRKDLIVESDQQKKLLMLRRRNGQHKVVCQMNFAHRIQDSLTTQLEEDWYKIFDSAEEKWNGPGAATPFMTLSYSKEGRIKMQPESIVIYSNYV